MNHDEYLIAVQLISDEGPGRKVRRQEAELDQQDAKNRRALGVVDG